MLLTSIYSRVGLRVSLFNERFRKTVLRRIREFPSAANISRHPCALSRRPTLEEDLERTPFRAPVYFGDMLRNEICVRCPRYKTPCDSEGEVVCAEDIVSQISVSWLSLSGPKVSRILDFEGSPKQET